MIYFIAGLIVGQVVTWLYYEVKLAPLIEEGGDQGDPVQEEEGR